MTTTEPEPIRCALRVPGPPDEAFRRFIDLSRWWPLPYTWSGADFRSAAIEPRAGGRWFETDKAGAEKPWGAVRIYEPGRRLVLSFNVGARRQPEPPERQSQVRIDFLPEADGTRVELTHEDLGRHGEDAEALRQGMASPQGWPLILADFEREMRLKPPAG